MKKTLALIVLLTAATMVFGQIPARTLPAPIPTKTGDQAQSPAPATPQHQPQAKSKDEFKAYQEAAGKTDAAASETAADDFAKKYPKSELRAVLYQHAMILYQAAGNADKTVDLAHKTLALDPNNGPALAFVASTYGTRTAPNDPNKDQRFAEARKDADHVVELAAAGTLVPPGTPAPQVADYQRRLLLMSYTALSMMDVNEKKYPEAENAIKKTIELSQPSPDPVSYYQLAWVQQKQGKNQDALEAAKKCVASSTNLTVADTCTNMVTALQKLLAAAPAKPAAAPDANPAPAAK